MNKTVAYTHATNTPSRGRMTRTNSLTFGASVLAILATGSIATAAEARTHLLLQQDPAAQEAPPAEQPQQPAAPTTAHVDHITIQGNERSTAIEEPRKSTM